MISSFLDDFTVVSLVANEVTNSFEITIVLFNYINRTAAQYVLKI